MTTEAVPSSETMIHVYLITGLHTPDGNDHWWSNSHHC